MNVDTFCRAFCENTVLQELPIGYVLKTPFTKPDGDALAIYIRRLADGQFRFEDDGQTIAYLEASGVDLDSQTRFEAFGDLLREHNAYYDEHESLVHTSALSASDLPRVATVFMALMLRIDDLLVLASSRVRSTFRDDLIELVKLQFGSNATIELNAPLQDSMKDYLVDIVVRSPDNRALAIYAATSELRALEAMLFIREARDQKVTNARAMLVVETSKPREIKERTYSRVINSDLILASMDGDRLSIARKMEDTLVH